MFSRTTSLPRSIREHVSCYLDDCNTIRATQPREAVTGTLGAVRTFHSTSRFFGARAERIIAEYVVVILSRCELSYNSFQHLLLPQIGIGFDYNSTDIVTCPHFLSTPHDVSDGITSSSLLD
jgi:hypothetical protein